MWRIMRQLYGHLSVRGWLFFAICVVGFVADLLALATDAMGALVGPQASWRPTLATLNAVSTTVAVVALVVVVAVALLIVTSRREHPRR